MADQRCPERVRITLTAQDIIGLLLCEDDDRDTHDEEWWIDERAEYEMEQEHHEKWLSRSESRSE